MQLIDYFGLHQVVKNEFKKYKNSFSVYAE